MKQHKKNVDRSSSEESSTDDQAAVAEATIVAGGEIVGATVDEELLVEGPNSK